jgi:hypothetical protein
VLLRVIQKNHRTYRNKWKWGGIDNTGENIFSRSPFAL